jgi:hypothetical protein
MEISMRLELEQTPSDGSDSIDPPSTLLPTGTQVRNLAEEIVNSFAEKHRELFPDGCGQPYCYACGDFCQAARNEWFLKQITRRERKF